jgi:hypothetical protein
MTYRKGRTNEKNKKELKDKNGKSGVKKNKGRAEKKM